MVLQNHDTMSVSEREQTKFIHRERRMSIMNEVHDIMYVNDMSCGGTKNIWNYWNRSKITGLTEPKGTLR